MINLAALRLADSTSGEADSRALDGSLLNQPQRQSDPQTEKTADVRPWSPVALTLLSLVIGVGALIVAVRNLQRLEAIDSRAARFYTWATIGLMASVFVLIWSFNPKTFGHSAGQLLPVSLGAPVACYLIQINSFRQWKQQHPDIQMRPGALRYCPWWVLP